jgi:hypothetical protein
MLLNETVGFTAASSTIAEIVQFYIQREKVISPPKDQRISETSLIPVDGMLLCGLLGASLWCVCVCVCVCARLV